MRLDAVRTVVYPKGTGGMDMNLCMKQKVFSWGDRFTVWDENGNDRYYVRGEVFSLGKKLHLTDTAGAEVAFIQQKAFSFKPRFYVYMNGALQAEIVKDFTFFTHTIMRSAARAARSRPSTSSGSPGATATRSVFRRTKTSSWCSRSCSPLMP